MDFSIIQVRTFQGSAESINCTIQSPQKHWYVWIRPKQEQDLIYSRWLPDRKLLFSNNQLICRFYLLSYFQPWNDPTEINFQAYFANLGYGFGKDVIIAVKSKVSNNSLSLLLSTVELHLFPLRSLNDRWNHLFPFRLSRNIWNDIKWTMIKIILFWTTQRMTFFWIKDHINKQEINQHFINALQECSALM